MNVSYITSCVFNTSRHYIGNYNQIDTLYRETFSKYIRIDLRNPNNIEFPVFCFRDVNNIIGNRNYTELVIPLYAKDTAKSKATAEKFLDFLFNDIMSNKYRLIKVKLKNTTYYGNRGVIFDENFNILFLTTYTAFLNPGGNYSYGNPKVYISPRVLVEKKNPLYKYIVEKMIPLLANNSIYYYVNYDGMTPVLESYITPIDVKIKNADLLFTCSPIEPSTNNNNDELINNLLIQNIDSVTDYYFDNKN